MITAVCKIKNYGLTWNAYGFADHHTENLEIFEVNTWVNLELYGTLIRGDFNGCTDCITITKAFRAFLKSVSLLIGHRPDNIQ